MSTTTTAAKGPAGDCDPDYCELEASGRKCPPGLCGRSGRFRPKPSCREPQLFAGSAALAAKAPAAAPLAASEEKIAALWKARGKAVRSLFPAAERLVKALGAARKARALSSDEEDQLKALEGWLKRLASEAKGRRPK